MKIKKLICSFIALLTIICTSHAQIYVNSGGWVTVGSATPSLSGSLQVYGDALYCNSSTSNTSSAYIRSLSTFSGASNPDYTWAWDNTTGFYHPAWGNICFTIGGTELLNMQSGQVCAFGTSMCSLTSGSTTTWDVKNGTYNYYVYGTGAAWATSYNTLSDASLKENIKTIPNALDKVLKMRGVTYTYNSKMNIEDSGSVHKTHMGVIAQEVEKIIPEVVNTGKNGIKGVEYANLIGLLIEAVKEQNSRIDSLKTQLNNCCNAGQMSMAPNSNGSLSVTSSTSQAALYQNVPNPFTQNTTITCYIPEESANASLMICDMTGALKTSLPVNGKDTQKITVSGGQLAAGMYYYTLIIDGKEIATKKMILTK